MLRQPCFTVQTWFVGLLVAATASAGRAEVGVFSSAASPWGPQLAAALTAGLASRGVAVTALADRDLASQDLADPASAKTAGMDLVVVCDATRVPAVAIEKLAAFARRGGKLMVLGGPFFSRPSWEFRGRPLERDALLEQFSRELKPRVLFDFDTAAGPAWLHSSSNPRSVCSAQRAEGGAAGTPGCLELDLRDVSGWDTFLTKVDRPFPAGSTWTTFWARGESERGPSQLMVEWQERDGSRWITVVHLARQWRLFALPPQAFGYWTDPRVPGRGGPGDMLRPENAAQLTIGLAQSHADLVSTKGRHRIGIDQVGVSPPPLDSESANASLASAFANAGAAAPVIEGVSPAYKCYPVTNTATFRVSPGQLLVEAAELPKPKAVYSPHPRPDGAGFRMGRSWRARPLAECVDGAGRFAGAAASLILCGPKPGDGGMIAAVGVDDPDFFASAATRSWLVALAARMIDGVALYEGGTARFASFGGEKIPVGATVSNRGRAPAAVTVEAVVRDASGAETWRKSWPLGVPPGEARSVDAPVEIPPEAADPLRVCVTLVRDGRPIDRIEHELRVWRPNAKPRFVTARDGGLLLGDAPWFAHGVNYMPSSGIGSEDYGYFGNWLSPRAYQPQVVQRDLERLRAVGLNAVSVFVDHGIHRAGNLLDLLVRCEALGIKVNLSLRPGTPMDFPWNKMREIVEHLRLAENDTLFAYDLAWEPLWGTRDARRQYDRLWQAWIEKRYGSLAAAEAAWKFAVPRDSGRAAGPSDAQVAHDGPHAAMALDYRRFLNELLHERYGRARELMRSIDRRHLVSFRMSMAGDPTRPPAEMTYDPAGLARAVDLMEPEGYGRIGDWHSVRPGWFTTAYCRAVAPSLPVVWAEFGYTVWSQAAAGPVADRLAFAERFYEDFYTMAYKSGSNGTFAWYSSGGYRVDEKSDYGILNPDGSWRPHTHVMHRWAAKMTQPRAAAKPDVWIDIELGRDVDGIAGVYRRAAPAFWKAVESGKTPGLRLKAPR